MEVALHATASMLRKQIGSKQFMMMVWSTRNLTYSSCSRSSQHFAQLISACTFGSTDTMSPHHGLTMFQNAVCERDNLGKYVDCSARMLLRGCRTFPNLPLSAQSSHSVNGTWTSTISFEQRSPSTSCKQKATLTLCLPILLCNSY